MKIFSYKNNKIVFAFLDKQTSVCQTHINSNLSKFVWTVPLLHTLLTFFSKLMFNFAKEINQKKNLSC